MREPDGGGPSDGTRILPDDALVVFLSDTHVGGDPGHDIFESPGELAALLGEISEHDGPVELVLAGDFFDFLLIGDVPRGENRAATTTRRPEYRELFSALRSFAAGDGRRVVYMPGNHDAEVWWNAEIRETLVGEGLVDEFVLSHAVRFRSAPGRLVYCEHGNQFDPANTITDYGDRLDTPLGDHIVTDLTRRIPPSARVGKNLDLGDIVRVFPLVDIPAWLAARVFYDLLGRATTRLLLPLLAGYAAYRVVAYVLSLSEDDSFSFWDSYRSLPGIQNLFGEVAWDALLLLTVFVLFFLAIKRTAARLVSTLASPGSDGTSGAARTENSRAGIRNLLASERHPPMGAVRGCEIDVFVSGHTHLPDLSRLPRETGDDAVILNSGCWLRQLQPVKARLRGPPVFVSRFVLTHARVYLDDSGLRAELWEHPKPAPERLRATERLALLGRLPAQPAAHSEPRISASANLPADGRSA